MGWGIGHHVAIVWISTILIVVFSLLLVLFIGGIRFIGVWTAMVVGLIAGNIIGFFTEYYTSDNYRPTRELANEAETGSATLIIQGHSLGMLATFVPVLTVVFTTLIAFYLSGGAQVTSIGLYDGNDNLLAVAKLSRPVEKNDEKDLTFRIRLDF